MRHMEISVAPYRPARAELLATEPVVPALFDFSGRLSLPRFLLWHFGLVVLLPWLLIGAVFVGFGRDWVAATALLVAIAPLNLLLALVLFIRRGRDLGLPAACGALAYILPGSGWLLMLGLFELGGLNLVSGLLVLILPTLAGVLAVILMIWPGKQVPNRFGPPNIALRPLEKGLLGVLAAALVALLVAALVHGPVLAAGGAAYGEWLRQLF